MYDWLIPMMYVHMTYTLPMYGLCKDVWSITGTVRKIIVKLTNYSKIRYINFKLHYSILRYNKLFNF